MSQTGNDNTVLSNNSVVLTLFNSHVANPIVETEDTAKGDSPKVKKFLGQSGTVLTGLLPDSRFGSQQH